MHSHQESFETSCLALITQGRPGADEEGYCSYIDGCAAAHLVAPEFRNGLRGFADQESNAQIFIDAGHDPRFARSLQSVHDEAVIRNRYGNRNQINISGWRKTWLLEVCHFAQVRSLDPSRVLEAAKAAGWEVLAA